MRRHNTTKKPSSTAGMLSMPAVFASGLLLAAIALVLCPKTPWLALPACFLPLLPPWLRSFRSQPTSKVFAPDPIAPDFAKLADDLAEDLQASSLLKTSSEWLLCPVLDGQGDSAPYSIDFDSNKRRLIILAYGRKTIRKTGALVFRPALPLPLVIEQTPIRLRISPCKRKH